MTVAPYIAVALQTTCHAVNHLDDAATRAAMLAAIDRIGGQIRTSRAFIGPDARLFVLPEYFLTGFPLGDAIDAWAHKAALAIDGPEYAALGRLADDNDIFIAGNAYELDDAFPGLYFQTSFLIDDTGAVALRYRRLVSMFTPTPHDVWDRYLDLYGIDGVFPVADTALGRIAAIASEEILYPEIARALALRGAELFVHSTSEIGSPELTSKDIAKRARALENLAFVVSANSAGIDGIAIPRASTDGMSKLVDFRGRVMAEAGYGESMVAQGEIDIEALRRYRRRPGMGNMLSRQRLELFAGVYGGAPVYPANSLLDEGGGHRVPDRGHFGAMQCAAIQRLIDSGVI
ncbi:MAG: nitrilase [Gammaproteobacteria bacterium]|nr:nitrilase [Gammaproteobacteria bacterium]NNM01781.1 nitrilase [Gammaproteobacteria bacterium]